MTIGRDLGATAAPQRLQRQRRRGWRMPAGAVYVGRPSVWGNPFAVTRSSDYHGLAGSWFVRGPDGVAHHPDDDTQTSARRKAVELYATHLVGPSDSTISVEAVRTELAGHDLVCWCPRSEPCHADVLLVVANAGPEDLVAELCGALGHALGCPDCCSDRHHAPG